MFLSEDHHGQPPDGAALASLEMGSAHGGLDPAPYHRMALVGLGVLLWWLGAMAAGPGAYETFATIMGSPLGMVVLVGLSWAFFTHMMSGLRHFVLDIGAGYELETNKTWSILAPLIGILLTAGFWALILLR